MVVACFACEEFCAPRKEQRPPRGSHAHTPRGKRAGAAVPVWDERRKGGEECV